MSSFRWLLVGISALFSQVAEAEIRLDGSLDEPEWQRAELQTAFVVTEPLLLSPSEERTEVRYFSDESGIYFGFVNYQLQATQRLRRHPKDEASRADSNTVNH